MRLGTQYSQTHGAIQIIIILEDVICQFLHREAIIVGDVIGNVGQEVLGQGPTNAGQGCLMVLTNNGGIIDRVYLNRDTDGMMGASLTGCT